MEVTQRTVWNGTSGKAWVDAQAVLDRMLQPFEDVLVKVLVAENPRRVLDVGCGTGSTTFAYARSLAEKGATVTGLDISEPMITVARARAERERPAPTFLLGDAQSYSFEPESFDMLVSRFGVMFFEDPAKAFTNLRSAAAKGGGLRFIAWRSPADNAFMTTAERAAAPFLPNLPVRRPDEPGQFAFGDRDRVHRILSESGWSEIDIQPFDEECTFAEKDLIPYVSRFGLVGRVLNDADDKLRAQVIETVRPAFDPFVHGPDVRFTSACWMIRARA